MSVSIGTSLTAQRLALGHEAPSLIAYNGHAGLGANLVGLPPHAAADGRSVDSCKNVSAACLPEVDDEVLVAFECGEPRRPVVIAPLWDSEIAPPESDSASAKHPSPPNTDDRGVGDDTQLRLQTALTRLTQPASASSDTLRHYQGTADAIVKNLKA